MDKHDTVAKFVQQKVDELGKSPQEIVRETESERSERILQIVQGRADVSLDDVACLAQVLRTNPVPLARLCLKEKHPETWAVIAPLLESSLTEDELKMVKTWRSFVGSCYVAVLTDESRELLVLFLESLKTAPGVH